MIPATLSGYYELHAPIYDNTRWAFLFGRNSLRKYFPNLPMDSTILDVGCGTGKQVEQLVKSYPDSNIIGIDPSKAMLSRMSDDLIKKTTIVQKEYREDTFSEESIDLIVCSYSSTMMGSPETLISKFYCHLKTNGHILVVDFDASPFTWFKKWMNTNHVDMFSGLFSKLQNNFETRKFKTQQAYFGLYSFSTFLGQKSLY